MYYRLLIRRFVRSRATLWAFALLMILGLVSIGVGRQFLDQQQDKIARAWEQQAHHIDKHVGYHPDDIGLLLYYLKFSYINPTDRLAGIAIGQSDLNTSVQNVTILNLEGQRYDTDLVNPSKLQIGNLDLSFVIIFLFPLVIIALSFNVLHEEVERGTWRMIRIQGGSPLGFYLAKLSVRILLVCLALALLLGIAIVVLEIPLDLRLGMLVLVSFLYVLFWFAVCFALVSFQLSGSVNAVVLLTLWLVLVILVPVGINGYVTSRYPVGEALSLTIRQRDEYHKRWDTDKRETMNRFLERYPQFASYPLKEEGFSWPWYYAMQHMGDDQSRAEREGMLRKIHHREALSDALASFLPPVKIQLAMNELAHTDLSSYLDFLEGTARFHERMRLDFYPRIWDDVPATSVDWSGYVPQYHEHSSSLGLTSMLLAPIISTALLALLGLLRARRLR